MIAHCPSDGKRHAHTHLTDHRGSPLTSEMTDPQSVPEPALRSRWLLPVLFAPVFMVLLDVFIVNVAAPSLRADIGASDSDLQWSSALTC